jgi:hypothetical protein
MYMRIMMFSDISAWNCDMIATCHPSLHVVQIHFDLSYWAFQRVSVRVTVSPKTNVDMPPALRKDWNSCLTPMRHCILNSPSLRCTSDSKSQGWCDSHPLQKCSLQLHANGQRRQEPSFAATGKRA